MASATQVIAPYVGLAVFAGGGVWYITNYTEWGTLLHGVMNPISTATNIKKAAEAYSNDHPAVKAAALGTQVMNPAGSIPVIKKEWKAVKPAITKAAKKIKNLFHFK